MLALPRTAELDDARMASALVGITMIGNGFLESSYQVDLGLWCRKGELEKGMVVQTVRRRISVPTLNSD